LRVMFRSLNSRPCASSQSWRRRCRSIRRQGRSIPGHADWVPARPERPTPPPGGLPGAASPSLFPRKLRNGGGLELSSMRLSSILIPRVRNCFDDRPGIRRNQGKGGNRQRRSVSARRATRGLPMSGSPCAPFLRRPPPVPLPARPLLPYNATVARRHQVETEHPLDLHGSAAVGHAGLHGKPLRADPQHRSSGPGRSAFRARHRAEPRVHTQQASFLTGRYPRTTRCRQNGHAIPADEVLVTRILADHGYVCGLSG